MDLIAAHQLIGPVNQTLHLLKDSRELSEFERRIRIPFLLREGTVDEKAAYISNYVITRN